MCRGKKPGKLAFRKEIKFDNTLHDKSDVGRQLKCHMKYFISIFLKFCGARLRFRRGKIDIRRDSLHAMESFVKVKVSDNLRAPLRLLTQQSFASFKAITTRTWIAFKHHLWTCNLTKLMAMNEIIINWRWASLDCGLSWNGSNELERIEIYENCCFINDAKYGNFLV